MGTDVSISFFGAAGSVTGARFLITAGGERLLVDCGLFQGLKELRLRNWQPFPVPAKDVDHLVLTHGHIDHSGFTPRLYREGYRGRYWGTPGTCDLLRVLLPDSAMLQEEQAAYANRKGFSKHAPALPLFTRHDADRVLSRLAPLPFGETVRLGQRFQVTYGIAGHILGSATALVAVDTGAERPLRIAFSGDLGRYDAPILRDPEPIEEADYLVIESTYGGRKHPPLEDAMEELASIVESTMRAGGVLLVPAFAVGRTQTLLYVLRELEDRGRIPHLPVYADSPMAIKTSKYYARHSEEHDEETTRLADHRAQPLRPDLLRFCERRNASKRLNAIDSGAIIISASGMLTGGRVLHHAFQRLPDPKNTLLLTGYQAAGTRGRRLLEGETEFRAHGTTVPVRARIANVSGFSAHADEDELLRWTGGFRQPPRRTFVVHGEPEAVSALSGRLERDRGFSTHAPALGETVALDYGPVQK